jgi:hypothetical protein
VNLCGAELDRLDPHQHAEYVARIVSLVVV